ncbi:MAG TPA: GNAT family N-acetyltransferase [Methylocella sp.]|nr:GNAT family N-acetyltransferase [Methylocella sp.]
MNDLSLPIPGERVSIRRLEERDLEDLYALDTDPDVKRYVGGPVRSPRDEWISFGRAELGAETCPLAIALNEDGSFVGRASLLIKHIPLAPGGSFLDGWELQVLIARKYWCKGFGREVASELIGVAFALQEVTSVVAVVHPENTASRKLMDNLGFQYAGQKSSPGCWDDKHIIFRLIKPI